MAESNDQSNTRVSRRTSTPISKRDKSARQEFPAVAWAYSSKKYTSARDDVYKSINPDRYTLSPRSFYSMPDDLSPDATIIEDTPISLAMDQIVQEFSVCDMTDPEVAQKNRETIQKSLMSFDEYSNINSNPASRTRKRGLTNIWAVNSSHEISEDESEEQPIIMSLDEMNLKLYEIQKNLAEAIEIGNEWLRQHAHSTTDSGFSESRD